MPDCPACPITEALRMERDNAQTIVGSLQDALERLPKHRPPWWQRKRRKAYQTTLHSVVIKLARARNRVDVCERLLRATEAAK